MKEMEIRAKDTGKLMFKLIIGPDNNVYMEMKNKRKEGLLLVSDYIEQLEFFFSINNIAM